MIKKRIVSLLLIAVLSLSCLAVINHGTKAVEPAVMNKYSYMFFGTFDTAITLIGYAKDQASFDSVAQQAEAEFNRLHKLFNQYMPYTGLNNMYTLNNQAAQAPVVVEKDLFDLLLWSKENQHITQGQVNIALGAVLALWHDERDNADLKPETAKLPDMKALQEANKHTSIDDLVLNASDRSVYYADPLLKLDVGAVAKGYATEIVAQMLLKSVMPSFIINAGGNVRTGHPPLDGRASWGIGIQDPDSALVLPAGDDVMDVLFLSDLSFVTSGDYQRYYFVDGQRYHHLISPETLMPANNMRSVTIITRDSGYADLLSTAVFLMPFEEGYQFVSSLDGVDAFWVLNDRSIHMTPGAEKVSYASGYRP